MLLEEEESRDLWDVLREVYENGAAERESMTPENLVKKKIKDLLAAYDIRHPAGGQCRDVCDGLRMVLLRCSGADVCAWHP